MRVCSAVVRTFTPFDFMTIRGLATGRGAHANQIAFHRISRGKMRLKEAEMLRVGGNEMDLTQHVAAGALLAVVYAYKYWYVTLFFVFLLAVAVIANRDNQRR